MTGSSRDMKKRCRPAWMRCSLPAAPRWLIPGIIRLRDRFRCGGVHDKSFEHPGFRLKGYHQDITQTVAINKQQEKELERANIILKRQLKVTQSLGSIYEFIYYLNLKDDTFFGDQ